MLKLAIIGLGKRMHDVLDRFIETNECELTYVADPRKEEIKAELAGKGIDPNGVLFFDSAEEMLEDSRFIQNKPDGICIGTRCSLHAKYAGMVIGKGYPLFLEKPVCTNKEDLSSLEDLLVKYPECSDRVTVSFPLRLTAHVEKVKALIDAGEIGEIAQIQAWNNVPYAIGYYHKWYRDDNETGGLFLQKATHDFDYINYIAGMTPTYVTAVSSKQVFKGDRPAGLRCHNCKDSDTCLDYTADKGRESSPFDMCVFASDTGNEDSGSAILVYPNGMHAVYTQNFIARRNAGKRGARFIGHLGTLEFDWYTNEILIHRHYEDKTDKLEIDKSRAHFGGDEKLAEDFIRVMKGGKSSCTLESGIVSASLCLMAKQSAQSVCVK